MLNMFHLEALHPMIYGSYRLELICFKNGKWIQSWMASGDPHMCKYGRKRGRGVHNQNTLYKLINELLK